MGFLRATCAGLRCSQTLHPGWQASMAVFRCMRIMRPSTLGCGGNSTPSLGREPSHRASSVPIEQRSIWSLAWKTTSYRPSQRLWCPGSSSIITVRIPMLRLVLSWSRPCSPDGEAFSRQWAIKITLWPRLVEGLGRSGPVFATCMIEGMGHHLEDELNRADALRVHSDTPLCRSVDVP